MACKLDVSGRTHLVCLLGNPTEHSLSPAMHNLSFELLGIDAVYVCFDVQNEDLGSIVAAFRVMESWDGFNVTMPCKQAIIPYLDELDAAAKLIGAVNVVKKSDGKIVGFNTDGKGFIVNLAKHGVQVSGSRMVLIGPGGAGSAIMAQAALDGVSHIDVFARAGGVSHKAALELAERVMAATDCSIALHDLADSSKMGSCIQNADILVNASSVGMGEQNDETPVPAELIKSGMAVADVIYHPRETRFIRDAKVRGCLTVPGLGMLIEQAAVGESIWYDVQMPIEEIERRLFS